MEESGISFANSREDHGLVQSLCFAHPGSLGMRGSISVFGFVLITYLLAEQLSLSVSFELNTICIKQSQTNLEWPGYLVITKTCITAGQSLITSHYCLPLCLIFNYNHVWNLMKHFGMISPPRPVWKELNIRLNLVKL